MTEKKVYIWDTSIPEKWKKIAGEDHFVHISKSNRAKNTLEFLQATQSYIIKIRESMQESSSAAQIKWPKKNRRRSPLKTQKVSEVEDITEKIIQLDHSPLLPSISKESPKSNLKLPELKRLKKNFSANSLTSPVTFLTYINEHPDYTRACHERPPDFISLPKALKASFNRVLNSLKT